MATKQQETEATPQLSLLSEQEIYLFNEGTLFRAYEKLGAHLVAGGAQFSVWAPNAEHISVIGDFNGWTSGQHPLKPLASSGIWTGFVQGAHQGQKYKYHVRSRHAGYQVDKADPFGFCSEEPPRTASVLWDLSYRWGDSDWMSNRERRNRLNSPMSIYEMHLGSWKRVPEEGNRSLTYREMAHQLPGYLSDMGYTHVEFMPIMEHPFFGSWGYQVSGYFCPTARYGSPQDLMFLIDQLHQKGFGVILDWVPSHFPSDEHGLGYFDGTNLFEHSDPRQGFHPDWKSAIFNYGRNEVRSFLISNASFWLDKYHADGLRVDGVASMLYLNYSRKDGEWIPNVHGGNENLEAISFLRRFNEEVYSSFPGAQTIAEESTAWPMVSRPTSMGGLGFGLKWDMGWMHDALGYFSLDPAYRKYHHDPLTFRMLYACNENFVLSLSHDEVVHGKGSLVNKMAGDDWQKFANLRALFGYMYGMSGKKLMFMGDENGQWHEWSHEGSLDWHELQFEPHQGIHRWVRDLNRFYVSEPSLHEVDFNPEGFRWVDCSDKDQSVVSFLRIGRSNRSQTLVVCNLTPVPREHYRIGVPYSGFWREVLNSDAKEYWGSGMGNRGGSHSEDVPWQGLPCSLDLTLPPLSVLFFKSEVS